MRRQPSSLKIDEQDKKLYDVFSMFDFDDTDTVMADDLPFILKGLGLGPDVLSFNDVQAMQRAMDPSKSGEITFDTFKRVMKHSIQDTLSHEEQWKAFRLFDKEKKGFVSLPDLVDVAVGECNGLLTEEQCRFIINRLQGTNHKCNGLTFEDWKKALKASSRLSIKST